MMVDGNLERLVGLAHLARRVFERVAEIDGWPADLCGLCYNASMFLLDLARRDGIEAELGDGVGHFFVLYGDTVVDITATQFAAMTKLSDKVMVLPLAEAARLGNWWRIESRNTLLIPTKMDERLCELAMKVLAEIEVGETKEATL